MTLQDRHIAVLVWPGYQELEFWYPVLRAREEGAQVTVVAPSTVECESFLGYPVVGDAEAAALDAAQLDAVVVPGTVKGQPAMSDAQARLIKGAHAAGRPVYASGTGARVLEGLIGGVDDAHRAADADGLPAFVRRLHADLAR